MPWISKQVLLGMKQSEDRLWLENRRLLNIILRLRGDEARAAVEGEDLIEASREEQRARHEAMRPGNGTGRPRRDQELDPRGLEPGFDETQDIGGPY